MKGSFPGVETDSGVVRKLWKHSKVWKASMFPTVAPTGTSSKTAERPTFTAGIEMGPHTCTSLRVLPPGSRLHNSRGQIVYYANYISMHRFKGFLERMDFKTNMVF